MAALNIANLSAPYGVVLMDPVTGNAGRPLSVVQSDPYGANYTQINTNGTTTVNPNPGFYYGLNAIGLGTLWAASVYDVVVTGTSTQTNTLAAGISIGAVGVLGLGGPPGMGVKTKGALVVVTSGTLAGNLNCLWD